MASTPPKPSKQLGELLQEQQEPFILEVYLLERGYQKKNSLNFLATFGCCHGNSTNFLKKSASCGLNKSTRGIPHCSKILRTVCRKFVSIKEDQSMKSSDNRNEEYSVTVDDMDWDGQEIVESDRFSSASNTTVFNSCSESDQEETSISLPKDAGTSQALKLCNTREKEAATYRKLWPRCMKDLEEVPCHEVQQNARIRREENPTACPKKVLEDSLKSASLRFLKLKRVLEKTKKLLFDCVREVVETHERNERGQQHYKQFLGPEELGKLICERIKSWGKQAGDKTNINYFLDLDFMDLVEEWSAFEQQKREIEMEIGEAVLEDIKNELVTEMIDFLALTTC